MKLREWREESDWTLDGLATALGTVTSTIFRWELDAGHPDKRIPTRGFMLKIYQMSGGAVQPNDFYDLPPIGQRELPLDPAPLPLLDAVDAGGPAGAEAGLKLPVAA